MFVDFGKRTFGVFFRRENGFVDAFIIVLKIEGKVRAGYGFEGGGYIGGI